MLVAHNEIHHAPHHALEVSGNNHQIVNNHIHSVVLQTYDSGAIDNAYDGHSSGDLTWRGISSTTLGTSETSRCALGRLMLRECRLPFTSTIM